MNFCLLRIVTHSVILQIASQLKLTHKISFFWYRLMYSNQNLELALHSLPIIIQELLQKWLLGICITTCLLGLSVFFQIARTLYTILPGWEKRLLILSVEFHWSWLSVLETYSGPSIYTLPWKNICDLLQRMQMLALPNKFWFLWIFIRGYCKIRSYSHMILMFSISLLCVF